MRHSARERIPCRLVLRSPIRRQPSPKVTAEPLLPTKLPPPKPGNLGTTLAAPQVSSTTRLPRQSCNSSVWEKVQASHRPERGRHPSLTPAPRGCRGSPVFGLSGREGPIKPSPRMWKTPKSDPWAPDNAQVLCEPLKTLDAAGAAADAGAVLRERRGAQQGQAAHGHGAVHRRIRGAVAERLPCAPTQAVAAARGRERRRAPIRAPALDGAEHRHPPHNALDRAAAGVHHEQRVSRGEAEAEEAVEVAALPGDAGAALVQGRWPEHEQSAHVDAEVAGLLAAPACAMASRHAKHAKTQGLRPLRAARMACADTLACASPTPMTCASHVTCAHPGLR